jgi:hypothetical protein
VLTFYGNRSAARIALMKEQFVCVMLDGYLRGTGAEKEFLKSVGIQGNGFTYLTVGGKKLGGDSYLGANGLQKALDEFQSLPEEERKPKIERPADPGSLAAVPMVPPAGTLIANVFFTYLEKDEKGQWRRALWHVEGQPGSEPGSGAGRNQFVTHVDKLWLTEAEWKSLLPADAAKGRAFPLPDSIAKRLVRFYASDLAHRSTGDKIRGSEFTLTVEESSQDGLMLRLDGRTETGCSFEEAPPPGTNGEKPGLCGADYRFLGHLHYSAAKKAFDRFEIVALGEGWGGGPRQAATTNFYRGGEHRRWPMGLAIELVTTDRPVDRIPPQNANTYRAGDAYFGKGKR